MHIYAHLPRELNEYTDAKRGNQRSESFIAQCTARAMCAFDASAPGFRNILARARGLLLGLLCDAFTSVCPSSRGRFWDAARYGTVLFSV